MLQAMLADVFTCGAMLLSKPFSTGDYIKVTTTTPRLERALPVVADGMIWRQVGGNVGKVKHIGLKDTRLTSLDGEELVYPNKEIGQAHITNYSKITTRRQKQHFHLALASEIEMIEKVRSEVPFQNSFLLLAFQALAQFSEQALTRMTVAL